MARVHIASVLCLMFLHSISAVRMNTESGAEAGSVVCPVIAPEFDFQWHYKADKCFDCSAFLVQEKMTEIMFSADVCKAQKGMPMSPACSQLTKGRGGFFCSCSPTGSSGQTLFGFRMTRGKECSDQGCYAEFQYLQSKSKDFSPDFRIDEFENPMTLCKKCKGLSPDSEEGKECFGVKLGIQGLIQASEGDEDFEVNTGYVDEKDLHYNDEEGLESDFEEDDVMSDFGEYDIGEDVVDSALWED